MVSISPYSQPASSLIFAGTVSVFSYVLGMESDVRALFLTEAVIEFEKMKQLAENALAQVNDDQFFQTLDAESNSLALIVKHMVGNMRSRWTDFLTSDGEKPWRNRDSEFVITQDDSRASLMERWEANWQLVITTIKNLTSDDLLSEITIRGEKHLVLKAINRQLTHYSYHVGQIVFLAKHLQSDNWKNLSVPKGKSQNFNADMFGKHTK